LILDLTSTIFPTKEAMNPPLAKDIMVTKLVTLPPDTHVAEAIRLLVKHGISGTPVVQGDGSYLGMFSEKCCMRLFDVIAQCAKQQRVALPTLPDARQIMSTKLVTLYPSTDVFKAISDLLDHRISGAPVVDQGGRFLGVFSEKTSMSVLVQAAYEQLPSTEVAAFMDADFGRTILEDVCFLDCARIFRETPYRRLPVLRGGRLVGLVSRRDVLRNSNELATMIQERQVVVSAPPQCAAEDTVLDRVRHFLDVEAETIDENTDLLSIAKEFLHTPYRRFPVVRDGRLVGQVSRRDVLSATHSLMEITPQRESSLLYLSALNNSFHH
jgi:CBS domain-containing protein